MLRSATPDDIGAVLELWRGADAEVSRTDDVGGLRVLVAHDPGALVVAEDDGAVVGSVICAWDGWRGSVYRLAVAPTHRRRGLGRRLVAEAETRLAARGARRLQAVVVDGDDRATGFWRASTWEEQARRIRFVR
ncbi:MAG TPA: GNAT family N-acetyltransferase [Acidimicrobiales bacterium]|nr:GNAT family N-acetyltransferase [Acidimicrobiales bacterium]